MRTSNVATDDVEFEFHGDEAPLFTRRPDGVATIVLPRYVALAVAPSLERGSPLYVGGYRYTVKKSAINQQTGDRSLVLQPVVG